MLQENYPSIQSSTAMDNSNRSYNNFIRGRGYTGPKSSPEGKLSKKNETGQKATCTFKVWEGVKRDRKGFEGCDKAPAFHLIQPLAVKSYFLMFPHSAVFGIFMSVFGGSGPVQQNEFDLNKSWLQISKRDREKSNDKVDYWTNIDDMIFFMNFSLR